MHFLLFTLAAYGAIAPRQIPRKELKVFHREGIFEGGSSAKANLEGVFLSHEGASERWTFVFSGESRKEKNVIPKFQLRFDKEETSVQDGEPVMGKPARFVLMLQSLADSYLSVPQLKSLARKSHFIREIIQYPAIEDGDRALEMILNSDVAFDVFHPVNKPGHLVLVVKKVA